MESQLLGDGLADTIVTLCRTTMGDHLRSVTYFTRNDYEQLYLREDLEQDADLTTFIGNEWYGFQVTEGSYAETELGRYRYSIRVFENGYLVRYTTDHDGVFLTSDGLTTRRFDEVVAALDDILTER
ncbi:MAG: hypothetical protein U5J98_01200 [Halobacteriales archaeon]|nr:hypothetical protein [Halobacteriales archaeon]